MKIAILGAGAFGTALGGILAEKGYDVDYYDTKVEKERLSGVLCGAKTIVLAVPSEAAPHVLPYLPKNVPLIVATKGLMSEKYFVDFKKWAIISGPGFADDIKAAKATKLTATDDWAADLFATSYLTFDKTQDKRGVLMCGALKNVYAILAGFRGLEPGTNEHNKFLNDAAHEMETILGENGANAETVELVCGKADLKITCYFPSRNYEFGRKLKSNPNYRPEKTVEGVTTLKKICRGEIEVPEDTKLLHELIRMGASWA